MSLLAGCLDSENVIARCASQGVSSGSEHLRRIGVVQGEEQISLGVLVSEEAAVDEAYHAVRIRDSDDALVASVPLLDNRDMNRLEPDDYPKFSSGSGELYAVPLGHPPVHGEFTASLVGTEDDELATANITFNCYADDGTLP
jgi:hypothetical protein